MLEWLGSWLDGLWKAFKAWFTFFYDVIVSFFQSFFLTLYDLLKDVFLFVVDSIFKLLESIIGSLPFDFEFLSPCNSSLSAEIMNILGLVGIGEAMGIIVTAIGIRILLQLIPFTRLGS